MKKITVRFKNNDINSWIQDEWDDYSYEGPIFVVKKNGAWVGIYNMDEVQSITVQ